MTNYVSLLGPGLSAAVATRNTQRQELRADNTSQGISSGITPAASRYCTPPPPGRSGCTTELMNTSNKCEQKTKSRFSTAFRQVQCPIVEGIFIQTPTRICARDSRVLHTRPQQLEGSRPVSRRIRAAAARSESRRNESAETVSGFAVAILPTAR